MEAVRDCFEVEKQNKLEPSESSRIKEIMQDRIPIVRHFDGPMRRQNLGDELLAVTRYNSLPAGGGAARGHTEVHSYQETRESRNRHVVPPLREHMNRTPEMFRALMSATDYKNCADLGMKSEQPER